MIRLQLVLDINKNLNFSEIYAFFLVYFLLAQMSDKYVKMS